MIFQESNLAHSFLDGLSGLEIGGAAQNPFGLKTVNVDNTLEETVFKKKEMEVTGGYLKVDVVAKGDELPFRDDSQDFVVSSHVLEHFFDPISALKEWYRVIRDGGYIFMIVPHKERTFDKDRPRTTLQELNDRHSGAIAYDNSNAHHSVWITEDILELAGYLRWRVVFFQDIDDKVGNGFTVVIQKGKHIIDPAQIGQETRTTIFEQFSCLLRSSADIESLVLILKEREEARKESNVHEALLREEMISTEFSRGLRRIRNALKRLLPKNRR
jgi:ubiquinone/menaquinone biosynthesis C-methylase UbiE